jgi:hypothetical protein
VAEANRRVVKILSNLNLVVVQQDCLLTLIHTLCVSAGFISGSIVEIYLCCAQDDLLRSNSRMVSDESGGCFCAELIVEKTCHSDSVYVI